MSDDIEFRTPSYRVPRGRGMDPATRRLALIAAGLGAALLVLIGAWSMTGPSRTGLPVLAPPAGPLREKPATPGGMRVSGAGQAIFGPTAQGKATGGVMAPPEQPDLAALRPPAPAATASGPAGLAAASSGGAAGGPRGEAPIAASGAAPAGPLPAATTALLPLPPAFRAPRAGIAPAAASRTAIGAPGTAPAAPRPLRGRSAAPYRSPPRATAASGPLVQLAALPTRAAALAEWGRLRRRMPGLLGAHPLVLAKASVGGHEWWRVRSGGFASRAAAARFCTAMRASGAACDVTPF